MRRVFVLNAPSIRCSAPEPCGGIIPIWRANVIESLKASLLWIRPSRTVSRSKPSSSIGVAGRGDAAEVPGSGEGALQAPLHAAAIALGGRRDDLHVKVRHGLDQRADELAHALGSLCVDLPAHVLAAALRPQRDGGVELAGVDRGEVAARHRLGLAAGDAFAGNRSLLHAGGGLLHLGARVAGLLPLGHTRLLDAAEEP